MRLGCCGCLLLLLLVGIGGLSAAGWLLYRVLEVPETHPARTTVADGLRAQQKIYDIVRRATGSSGRKRDGEVVVLTEPEINAFLSHHLAEAGEVPLGGSGVTLVGDGVIHFVARIPLRYLLAEPPLASLRARLPESWLDQPGWLQFRAHVRLERAGGREARRYIRLDIDDSALGRQRVPVQLVPLLVGPAAMRMLRWQVPETVESLTIERGRVVVRTASPHARNESEDHGEPRRGTVARAG